MAAALIGGVAIGREYDRDWHPALTIDGQSIDRADFRGRAAVFGGLGQVQAQLYGSWVANHAMSQSDASRVEAATFGGDPVALAQASFAADHVVAAEARSLGLAAARPSPIAAVEAAIGDAAGSHVRWFSIERPLPTAGAGSETWPVASGPSTPGSTTAAAVAFAVSQLPSTPAANLVAAAHAAGWDAAGADQWLPASGTVGGLPDALATRLRAAPVGTVVGPYTDAISAASVVGVVLADHPTIDPATISALISNAGIDPGALRSWADEDWLERSVAAALAKAWAATPSAVVTAGEIVIGSAANGGAPGPYAGLAHLVLKQVPAAPGAVTTASPDGAQLALQLNAMSLAERLARWDQLVVAANGTSSSDPLARSGEIGWIARDSLKPAIALLAFDPGVTAGTVVGPVTTSEGSELFLVRGRFSGTLDDLTAATLTEVASSEDLATEAARLAAPYPPVRFTAGVTRSELEVAGNPDADAALFGDPPGQPSGPYVADGLILVAVPRTRATAIPNGQVLDRIAAAGFDNWVAAQEAKLTVVLDSNPLGALASPTVAPIPSVAPEQTPNLPVIPGLSSQNNPYALPTLPVPANPFGS